MSTDARLADLFDEVVDLDEGARAARLDDACVDDLELRRAVERLVERDRGAPASFMAAPVLPRTTPEGGALDGEPSQVGRFVLLRKLGEGSMGVVFEAQDDTLDRRIAVKILRTGFGAEEARARLLREAQALARLAHPNVVAVYEVGGERELFVAMELIPGKTLGAWQRERERSWGETLALYLQAARGLSAAHQAGVVHRDFKPENVLVADDGRARVVDFGLAAGVGGLEDERAPAIHDGTASPMLDSPITREGIVAGTPAYMAPELWEGKRASPESDQFSFAVALWQGLYGTHPFAGRVPPSGEIPPPPERGVPAWLERALRRSLALAPDTRWPALAHLVAVIDTELARDPELDFSVSRQPRTWLFVALTVVCTVVSLHIALGGGAPENAADALVFGLISGGGIGTVGVVFRRALTRNAINRSVASLIMLLLGVMILHRALAVLMDTPVANILVVDLLLFATGTAVIAIGFVRRWFMLAAVFAAGAALGAWLPASVVPIFSITTVVGAVLGIHTVRRASAY